MERLTPLGCLLLLIVTALVCGTQARAFDRVTLRNGFSYDCVDRQTIDPDHTRLFLSSTPEASYVDIPTAQIAAVDKLPNPPPIRAATTTPNPANDVASLLASAGGTHNIDAALLASIVGAESSGRARAVSHAGAQGLMQLMPGTARQLGVADSFQPEQNIDGGTAYLDALLTRYHDRLPLALAAYNAGPAAVDRFHGVPPFRETQLYVVRVMTEFKRRKEALAHQASAPSPAPPGSASLLKSAHP